MLCNLYLKKKKKKKNMTSFDLIKNCLHFPGKMYKIMNNIFIFSPVLLGAELLYESLCL